MMGWRAETLSLPAKVFTILRDLIRERMGLHYELDKRELLAHKLSPRALERGFDSFLDYYYLLKYGPDAADEWSRLMDVLSVPETYFWREMDQVQAFVDVLVPRFVEERGAGPLRVWSAGCATGEEPLSIAMALQESSWFGRVPIEIWASDASPANIERARRGVYRERSFRNLPRTLWQKYFTATADGSWRVAPELHDRVQWRVANLADAEAAPLAAVPFIFCRNVFIYFSAETIAQTVRQFAKHMVAPAYLFVGVTESLVRVASDFELREVGGAFVYVRRQP